LNDLQIVLSSDPATCRRTNSCSRNCSLSTLHLGVVFSPLNRRPAGLRSPFHRSTCRPSAWPFHPIRALQLWYPLAVSFEITKASNLFARRLTRPQESGTLAIPDLLHNPNSWSRIRARKFDRSFSRALRLPSNSVNYTQSSAQHAFRLIWRSRCNAFNARIIDNLCMPPSARPSVRCGVFTAQYLGGS
jgi:hypothetical protein